MARKAEGWRIEWPRGWAQVRFTWNGRDYRKRLLTRDRAEAQSLGAQYYADVVSGRIAPSKKEPGRLLDLAQLLDKWVASKVTSLDPSTVPTLRGYCITFADFFGSLDNITEATATDFGLFRLGQALRTTVLRERAYLVQFLEWCRVHGSISIVPHVPRLPPKALGTRTGKQRAKAVRITRAEAVAIIKLLPEQSKTIDGRRWPLRDRFEFMRLTGLRPETISRLTVPENWTRGAACVELANDDDKARYGRTVDIVPEARRLLMKVAPESGVIFGRHVFYKALKKAAAAVLDAARAKAFAPYDLRHLFARERLDDGAATRGVSYLLGHKRVSTTDKYLAPDREAGAEALRARRRQNRPNRTIHAPKKRKK